jgi:Predicted ATPase with chaperone activity
MLVRTFASAVTGIDAVTVTIEVNVSRGIQFFLVGLPDSAVRESHQRIESALRALNLHWPGKQVVINMAPADILLLSAFWPPMKKYQKKRLNHLF